MPFTRKFIPLLPSFCSSNVILELTFLIARPRRLQHTCCLHPPVESMVLQRPIIHLPIVRWGLSSDAYLEASGSRWSERLYYSDVCRGSRKGLSLPLSTSSHHRVIAMRLRIAMPIYHSKISFITKIPAQEHYTTDVSEFSHQLTNPRRRFRFGEKTSHRMHTARRTKTNCAPCARWRSTINSRLLNKRYSILHRGKVQWVAGLRLACRCQAKLDSKKWSTRCIWQTCASGHISLGSASNNYKWSARQIGRKGCLMIRRLLIIHCPERFHVTSFVKLLQPDLYHSLCLTFLSPLYPYLYVG